MSAYDNRAREAVEGIIAQSSSAIPQLLALLRATGGALAERIGDERVYILAPRPSCPPGEYLKAGNKAGGGTADWIWAVWDRTAPAAPTTMHWLMRPNLKETSPGIANAAFTAAAEASAA